MNKHSSHIPARSSVSRIKLTAVALLAAGLFTTVQAQVIGFDFTPNNGLAFGTTPTAMSPTDLAGVPGSRVDNWNMISSTSYSSSSVVDSFGATVSGLNVSLSAAGSGLYAMVPNSASANDYTMFNNVMDISSSATVSLTSIPYAAYDLIFTCILMPLLLRRAVVTSPSAA
jgi:hypothetical protein